ncbi:MAG: hypothetical protein JW908_04805 [Anaerolineales bacterium]|nr:hypothetical protein [Anaerolineales bacterium]
MRQKTLMICLILVLLMAGCGQQPETSAPAENSSSTELPAVVISPTEIIVETEAPAYPEPSTMETVPETAYPAPDTVVMDSPYPAPSTDVSGNTAYPGPAEAINNNITSPMNPIPGEESMTKGSVYLDKIEVRVLEEDNPTSAGLYLAGSLPTPCHYLRVSMTAPDAENKIAVEVFSLADPAGVCIQVLHPFETLVSLGSFTAGNYTIWVNGQLAGEYTQ